MITKDVKPIIAENLTMLRKKKGITQAELAERLDYSDKAVSRWEHGETLPDINVLCELCDFYGVTLDFLVQKGDGQIKEDTQSRKLLINNIIVCALAVSIVWLVATTIFIYGNTLKEVSNFWVAFIWAIPVSCVAVLRLGREWLPRTAKMIIWSLFLWTLITAVVLHFISRGLWLFYVAGVPAQVIIILKYVQKFLN
ncbi:MAG: helix-turn-helix transcriptional regulator [Ruminococcaceae bacterium]|nr:helix-turn-helix transcriptional regulator [Oscillospiraceae bacterium]